MDTATHYLALITVVAFPPTYLYWFLIHPFAPTWRKLGPVVTLALVLPVVVGIGAGLYWVREPLLRFRLGPSWPLIVAGVLCCGTSLWVEVQCRRHLKLKTLVGLPELSAGSPGSLLSEGIYAHVRNPRYLAVGLGLMATALITNYVAVYVLLMASVLLVHPLVLLEERELRQRFGEEYERYRRRVPRFLPRFRRAAALRGFPAE